jgi:hypothetical protein
MMPDTKIHERNCRARIHLLLKQTTAVAVVIVAVKAVVVVVSLAGVVAVREE